MIDPRIAALAPDLARIADGPFIEDLEGAMRRYLHLPNTDHIRFAAAVAVSGQLDGDPLWGLIVGPPSSSKTETIRAFDAVADDHLDEITMPGLLSWTAGKNPRATGLLARVGPVAFATIGDLSTLLASSDRGQRDTLFALLRRAYDGRVQRELGNAPEPLRWEGRLTLLAAVTPSIDGYSSHADMLGPRWLYCRLTENDTESRRQASRAARVNAAELGEHRARVRKLAAVVVRAAVPRARAITLPEHLADELDDAVLVTCLGRAAIERDGYGKREIRSMPTVEDPPRLSGQLSMLARGLLALGLEEGPTVDVCRRSALDSMPAARRGVLAALAGGEELTVAEIARRVGCHRQVARFAVEELGCVRVCRYRGDEDDEDADTKAVRPWRLAGPNARLVSRVLTAGSGR